MPKDYSKFIEAIFYKDAEDYREAVREAQIIKGADKYGVPLDPSNHTPAELVRHAMEENVDQSHYIVAMGQAFEALEKKHAADMKSMAGRVASGDKKNAELRKELIQVREEWAYPHSRERAQEIEVLVLNNEIEDLREELLMITNRGGTI